MAVYRPVMHRWSLVLVTVTGCSFAFGIAGQYRAPERFPASGELPCVHSTAPLVDAAFIGVPLVLGLIGAAIRSQSQPMYTGGDGSPGAAVVAGGIIFTGALFGSSALYGYLKNAHCREAAKRDARDVLAARATAAAATGDCATFTALDSEICAVDPDFHDARLVREPILAHCTNEADAIARCKLIRHDACVVRRSELYEQIKATSSPDERRRLVSVAPKCDTP